TPDRVSAESRRRKRSVSAHVSQACGTSERPRRWDRRRGRQCERERTEVRFPDAALRNEHDGHRLALLYAVGTAGEGVRTKPRERRRDSPAWLRGARGTTILLLHVLIIPSCGIVSSRSSQPGVRHGTQ